MSSPDRVATSSTVVGHETVDQAAARPGDRALTGWPFHPGERQAQARAGFESHGGSIRAQMPAQHRAFFEQLPFVVVAALQDGWPVTTLWSGAPGFVRAPDPQTLQIAVALDPADPTAPAFVPGAPFGLLGIELATRRRNRANGVIAGVTARGLTVAVGQSFGNCPQYIQPRDLVPIATHATPAERLDGLDRAAARAIADADVCFVASAARIDEPTGGVDVSHRGGPRGFVRVDGDVLTIPDYRGNRYLNTLGNLVSHPRAALVFPDFATGDLLHVQGTTEIQWDGPEVRALPGAERLWRVRVEHGWRRRGALALRALAARAT